MNFETTQKLMKLLQMTLSEADPEALTAIRLANKLLQKHDMGWEQLLFGGSRPKQETPRSRAAGIPADEDIDHMFDVLSTTKLPQSAADFIVSVYQQYRKKKRLSVKQYEAICRFYENAR